MRPSTSWAVIVSPVTFISLILTSCSFTAVLMPCLHYFVSVVYNLFPYRIEFFRRKTLVLRQCNRVQPEFAKHILSLNMHMHLFITIKAIEEKSIWSRDFLDR